MTERTVVDADDYDEAVAYASAYFVEKWGLKDESRYQRQVSVPWCTAHDAPYKGHPDHDAPMCLYAAWAVVDKPSLVGSCIIKDGVVWKVVTE